MTAIFLQKFPWEVSIKETQLFHIIFGFSTKVKVGQYLKGNHKNKLQFIKKNAMRKMTEINEINDKITCNYDRNGKYSQ